MFQNFENLWTPVVGLSALSNEPLAVEVAGEPVVVFRDGHGQYRALIDRCPHRTARLSLGQIKEDGSLQCRYHGWRFAGDDGRCLRVPMNDLPESARAKLAATALPARALAGALWVFTGQATDTEPALPPSLQGNPEGFGTDWQDWRAHWTRSQENFIDFAHLPYAHQGSIGFYSHEYAEGGGVPRTHIQETDFGFSSYHNLRGAPEQGFRFDWYRPNLTVLHFGPTDDSKLHIFSIPLDDQRTRVMSIRRLPPEMDCHRYASESEGSDNPVLAEDKLVVESQTGPVDLVGKAERSVPSDAPTIAFRAWYKQQLQRATVPPRETRQDPEEPQPADSVV